MAEKKKVFREMKTRSRAW